MTVDKPQGNLNATALDCCSNTYHGVMPGEASFCRGYQVVARIQMPVDNEERGQPIARCTLDGSLVQVWPRILALSDPP